MTAHHKSRLSKATTHSSRHHLPDTGVNRGIQQSNAPQVLPSATNSYKRPTQIAFTRDTSSDTPSRKCPLNQNFSLTDLTLIMAQASTTTRASSSTKATPFTQTTTWACESTSSTKKSIKSMQGSRKQCFWDPLFKIRLSKRKARKN